MRHGLDALLSQAPASQAVTELHSRSQDLWLLIVMIFALFAFGTCEDRPKGSGAPGGKGHGPEVESVPSAPHSCVAEPKPHVSVIDVPGAPVVVTLKRAQHLCLGEYEALLRLEGRSPVLVTQVVLDREWWDLRHTRPPRRDRQVYSAGFREGTVRYLRIRWREGLGNRGERVLRIRLARAHRAEGPAFDAGPWPALSPPPEVERPAQGLSDKLQRLRDGVQGATLKIREAQRKIEEHPLVRHRHSPAPVPRENARDAP